MNDIIVIKRKLNHPVSEFDKSFNEFAVEIFKKGYDSRFQTAQAIPVLINELMVRLFYAIRRLTQYFINEKHKLSFKNMWSFCEPFSNSSVKRMLTVAHGTFCLIDVTEATVRGFVYGGGSFNISEFILRLNIVGVGRFTVSLCGEVTRGLENKHEILFWERKKILSEEYTRGLETLAKLYNDDELLRFIKDFIETDLYEEAFVKTAELASKRNVPEDKILANKADIDLYFEKR